MKGTDINKVRIRNRLFEQIEKDEMIEKVIKAYGEAMFKIDQLKIENEILKEEKKMIFRMLEDESRK